jgi:hypothetical protein
MVVNSIGCRLLPQTTWAGKCCREMTVCTTRNDQIAKFKTKPPAKLLHALVEGN